MFRPDDHCLRQKQVDPDKIKEEVKTFYQKDLCYKNKR